MMKSRNLMVSLTAGILICVIAIGGGAELFQVWRYEGRKAIRKSVEEMYMPGLAYLREPPDNDIGTWLKEKALVWLPLVGYISDKETLESGMEDEEDRKSVV